MGYNLQFPINSVSFGQVSLSILYKLFGKQESEFSCFPLGSNMDFSSYSYPEEFQEWIVNIVKNSPISYSRNNPSFKLWHVNGARESLGRVSNLITFHETDRITDVEKNVLSNQDNVYVTSKYTKKVFEDAGLTNVSYWPLWQDSFHFKETKIFKKKYLTFGLYGKLEKRKAHIKTIKAWIKAYGANGDYRLNCCINNPFLFKPNRKMSPEETKVFTTESTKKYIQQELQKEGIDLPWNINFLNTEQKNDAYNRILNVADIVIGMSHCEGFDLPLFHSLALGKGAVVFNEHVHKDYCTENNAVLVEPNGKQIKAHDGVFFKEGSSYNQGFWPDWDEDEFIEALKTSESKTFIPEDLDKDFIFVDIFN